MFDLFKKEHGHLSEKDLLLTIAANQHFLISKFSIFMSQTSDLLAKLSDDLDGIATSVTGISQEIADLKAGQDDPVVVAKLTDLENRAAAVGASLKTLLPVAPPADGGETPPAETPAA